MQVDFLIIGQGLAGTVLSEILLSEGATVMILNDESRPVASSVAAGLYNPITGKRMTKTWKAEALFPFLHNFYKSIEKKYGCIVCFEKPIYKPFGSIEEQNNWLSDHEGESFIKLMPPEQYSQYLHTEYGGFETVHSGYIDINKMLEAVREEAQKKDRYRAHIFSYENLKINADGIEYEDIKAKKIIFCEGMSMLGNPYLRWLPMVPSKGEVLDVAIENFEKTAILNKQVFVIPLEGGSYRVGSTYQWVFDDAGPSSKGLEEITTKLASMIKMPFQVRHHRAGVRPSVKDRKPLIGIHPEHTPIALFNGLGTKGVSLAPYFARQFVNHLLYNLPLEKEVNIERFYSLYSRSE